MSKDPSILCVHCFQLFKRNMLIELVDRDSVYTNLILFSLRVERVIPYQNDIMAAPGGNYEMISPRKNKT